MVAERALAAVLDGVMGVTFVVAMALRMLPATVVVMVVAAAMAALAVVVGSAQARHQAREIEAQARERGYLSELVAGIATIKAAGAEPQACSGGQGASGPSSGTPCAGSGWACGATWAWTSCARGSARRCWCGEAA